MPTPSPYAEAQLPPSAPTPETLATQLATHARTPTEGAVRKSVMNLHSEFRTDSLTLHHIYIDITVSRRFEPSQSEWEISAEFQLVHACTPPANPERAGTSSRHIIYEETLMAVLSDLALQTPLAAGYLDSILARMCSRAAASISPALDLYLLGWNRREN